MTALLLVIAYTAGVTSGLGLALLMARGVFRPKVDVTTFGTTPEKLREVMEREFRRAARFPKGRAW